MHTKSWALYSTVLAIAVNGHVLSGRQEPAPTADQVATPVVDPTQIQPAISEALASAAQSSSIAAPAETSPPSSTPTPASQAPIPSSAPPSTFSLVPGSVPTLTASTTPQNETTVGDPEPLPLPPKLSPAVGLAGAILLISGIIYGLVGIRNKWLYTFFGVAYLVALSVMVLILYCMNPPASNGVQGAYFVGIFLSALLCGGVALVFRDLADGCGCLLGGFCFAMWFLTLKPGGTITNKIGKAVFIGSFTVAVGLLALTKKTRRWGLIACIPFAGATAAIIGIDCFSRAGMKEFWIYLWDINDDIFPLNTNTYPHTRGIKVEIAGIVLLYLLGLISQMKLSKVIKEKKEVFAQWKTKRQQDAARKQANASKQIISSPQHPAKWDQSMSTLTAVPSSETLDKKSFVVKERQVSRDLEMGNIRPLSSRVSLPSSEDMAQPSMPMHSQSKRRSNNSHYHRLSAVPSERALEEVLEQRSSRDVSQSRTSLAPPAPELVPLPFTIPGIEINRARSQNSLSAIEDDYYSQRKSTQRASGTSWKRVSARASTVGPTASREELVSPDNDDDDHASSVAATYDELDADQMSLSAVGSPSSPIDDDYGLSSHPASQRNSIVASMSEGQISPRLNITFTDVASGMLGVAGKPKEKRDSASGTTRPGQVVSVQDSIQVADEKRLSIAASDRLNRTGTNDDGLVPANSSKRSSLHSDARKSGVSSTSADRSSRLKVMIPEGPPQPLTQDVLSQQADGNSRITLQYRTNEWAKHISHAQEPEEDEMETPPSPGVQVDTVLRDTLNAHNTISPVVDPMQVTVPKPAAKRSSTDPTAHRRNKSRNEALAKLTAPSPAIPPPAPVHSVSQRNVTDPPPPTRQSSGSMPWPGPRTSRNYSSPALHQSIIESPIEMSRSEDPRKGLQKRVSASRSPMPSPMPQATLMQQRDSRLESQPKSQSFAQSAPNLAIIPATPSASVSGKTTPPHKSSTSERPSQAARNSSTSRHQSTSYTPSPVLNSQDVREFDSHQPDRRSSTVLALSQKRRENLLTNFRESLRGSDRTADELDEQQQRLRLLGEKRQKQARREVEQRHKAQKEEAMSRGVRSGGLGDKHREAMARMQAKAGVGQ